VKITEVEGIMLRLPEVKRIGDGCQSVLIIRIHTDAGIVGIGEAHTNPLVSKAILDAPMCSVSAEGLRSLLLGEDPRDIDRLWDKMYRHTQTYGRRGIAMHTISGVDIALWDIAGKIAGLPVHRLLGGARRATMPVYASDLSQTSLEATLATARRHRAAGYRAMKFGWGGLGNDAREDIAVAAALRREVGPDIDLMIDMGFAVPFDHAVALGRGLAEHRIFFLEEPLSPDDIEGFAKLVAVSPTPIATGEKESTLHPYLDLMDRGRLRIIQPDMARVGGLTEARRIATAAAERQVRVVPHCWSTDILVAATLHLVSTLPDCPYLEFNATANPLRTDLLVDPIRPVDGVVKVPEKPGLGIELNEETIERYRWKGV